MSAVALKEFCCGWGKKISFLEWRRQNYNKKLVRNWVSGGLKRQWSYQDAMWDLENPAILKLDPYFAQTVSISHPLDKLADMGLFLLCKCLIYTLSLWIWAPCFFPMSVFHHRAKWMGEKWKEEEDRGEESYQAPAAGRRRGRRAVNLLLT